VEPINKDEEEVAEHLDEDEEECEASGGGAEGWLNRDIVG